MHNLEKTPISFSPSNFFDFLDDSDANNESDDKFIWMFFIFTKHSNFLFIMNNLNSLKGFFFLQKFYTQTAKLPSISIQIKNKKSAFKRFFFLKKKKYLFSSRFKYNYLTKFKFFTKISKVKNVNLLKSPKTFFFNFHSTPHLSFFYKKFYPLTGFFLNSLSFPHFSFISEKENDAAAFLDDSVLNDLFTIKKIKIKRKKKSFSKLIKFKHFKKLLLSDIFYVSKKNYFWNFFFNKKNIKLNRAIATLSNFNSLPYSKAGLALSLNYKKNTHDLDKIILFSCELLLSSFLQFRSFFLRKKRYFRKSSAPYNARLLFGVKTRLPNFKKKLFKFNTFSRFLFKKAPLSYNTFKQNKFFSKRQSTALKPKFLLKTFSKFLKKKNYKLLNKILKDKNKFVKLRTFFLKSKNLRNKLNIRFLMLKHRFFFKKKKKLNKKNKPLMRFVSLFFVNLFFKSLKLKKKPAMARLSKYRKKSLRKKFKRFMNYLKIKRKSPSATRRSKRILKRKFRAISFRILKSSLIKFKFFKPTLSFIFKKKLRFSIISKPINHPFSFYKLKFFQQKKKLNFFFMRKNNFSFKSNAFSFYKKINPVNNPWLSFYDFIDSRINFNFTHFLSGFLYITDKISIAPFSENYIFHAKKTMHSFLFKNDLQNFIIKKHLKASSNPIFSNFSFTRKNFLYTLNKDVNLIDDNLNYFEKTHLNSFANIESFTQKNKKSFFEFNSKLNWLEHHIFMSYSDSLNDLSFSFSIKKIKFKPGYQKIWREARECLKTSLNVSFRYQQRLTRFVNRFKKIIRYDTHLLFETQLQNVLKSSRLVPDGNWAFTLLQNGSVFINGCAIFNPFFQVYKNDFVQLVVTHHYYFFYKWLIVWSTLKKFRFKAKISNKLSKKDLPDDKQRSRSTPSWVLRYRCFNEDAAKNLEIDYLTLSFFVLYEFSNLAELDSTPLFQHRLPVINMYNWKYIN